MEPHFAQLSKARLVLRLPHRPVITGERQESIDGEEAWRLRLTHAIGHFGTVSFPASCD